MADKIYVKTNVAGYIFDAFMTLDHQFSAQLCEHPVAVGADITDHVFIQPKSLQTNILMNDVMKSYVNRQFNNSSSRSVSAFKVLKKLMDDRTPIEVQTKFLRYTNMIIETLNVHEDESTQYGMSADVSFKEIIVATVSEVKIKYTSNTSDATTTAKTVNQGQVQASQTTVPESKKSALSSLTGRVA